MINLIFTLDYEIYGNGHGSLQDLIYDPAEKLLAIFRKFNVHFVAFVEAAELEMIQARGADPAIDLVKKQIRDFYREGFEVGLHLHPQWYNGRYEKGEWHLDYSEYNLCSLPVERIISIVDRSIGYFRTILGVPDFSPLSFRAGNWLFQPTKAAADVLSKRGIKVDSSVFKGGLQHQHNLDYRRAQMNGYFWKFADDVNVPDAQGSMIELPIYTRMVPPWQMFTAKRVGLQQKASSTGRSRKSKLYRLMDFLRFSQPLKLDFCRMTLGELTGMVDRVIKEDQANPSAYRPLVAIGHTKDLVDFDTVEAFLAYLRRKGIAVATLEAAYKNTGLHDQ
jgi:peptidoglycan/xylan/chitin deacetylase (PgdA/CDA1 family)